MDSVETISKDAVIKMIIYIDRKVDDLPLEDRKDILRIINRFGVSDQKVHSKGGGTQIKYKDIPTPTIERIYNYIVEKNDKKIETLKNFTEETIREPI